MMVNDKNLIYLGFFETAWIHYKGRNWMRMTFEEYCGLDIDAKIYIYVTSRDISTI